MTIARLLQNAGDYQVTVADRDGVVSIEHEDPFVDSKTGVKESAALIKSALTGSG